MCAFHLLKTLLTQVCTALQIAVYTIAYTSKIRQQNLDEIYLRLEIPENRDGSKDNACYDFVFKSMELFLNLQLVALFV